MMEQILADILLVPKNNPVVAYYVAAAASLLPMLRLYRRAGFGTGGAWLLLVPFVGYLLAMAGLVFRRWPVLPAYIRPKKEGAA